METWVKISSLLCVFGFLKEFRPSEPYITPFLMSPHMNFTKEQISQEIYPVATYSNMLSLIIVFLVTDLLRYKIVIIADAIAGVGVYLGLILFNTVFAVQVVEVLYGLFMAGEVAYYTYIYAKVDTEHFQEVTSHTRSAYLAGRALSGIVSQIIVYFQIMSYYHMLFITLAGLVSASLWACILPPVHRSVYFHHSTSSQATVVATVEAADISNSNCRVETQVPLIYAFQHLWSDFSAAFTNVYVMKWIVWWALSTCGYWQVLNYIQLLWQTIRSETHDNDPPLYGFVEAAYTLTGAMASMTMAKVKLNWASVGEPVLSICSLVIAAVLYCMSSTNSIAVAYVTYIFFTVIYHTMITVSNSEVAKHINRDSYGLIFGITTFLALLLQTGLTYVVNSAYRLPPRDQFVVYSIYFGVLGASFMLVTVTNLVLLSTR